jgi:hypothetical protein
VRGTFFMKNEKQKKNLKSITYVLCADPYMDPMRSG